LRYDPDMDEPRYEREERIPAPVEEVWEAISGPEGLGAWLGGEVEADPTPGGALKVTDGGESREGFFEEVDLAERRVSFWWRREGEDATRVEFELEEDGPEATRMRIVESRPLVALDAGGTLIESWAAGASGPQMRARPAIPA
jgi:uncharacterized protein YndB with AHSA1/START domain